MPLESVIGAFQPSTLNAIFSSEGSKIVAPKSQSIAHKTSVKISEAKNIVVIDKSVLNRFFCIIRYGYPVFRNPAAMPLIVTQMTWRNDSTCVDV